MTLTLSGRGALYGSGIAFASGLGMKMLLVSIALSALVLWAVGCGGLHV